MFLLSLIVLKIGAGIFVLYVGRVKLAVLFGSCVVVVGIF